MKKLLLILFFFCALPGQAQNRQILFVMSAARELPLQGGKTYTNTGVFLSEFYLAYRDLLDQGYQVSFATPGGKVAGIDQESYDKKYWKGREGLIAEARQFLAQDSGFNHPMPLEQALSGSAQYSGLVVPGGQGLMSDLIQNNTMQQLILSFARQEKCVGLICHAPALLTAFPKDQHPYAGYRVNAVSGLEEWFIERFVMKGKPLNRKIGKQLNRLGLRYRRARPAANFAVRDRFLVTSQNPFSHRAFSTAYLAALRDYEKLHPRQ